MLNMLKIRYIIVESAIVAGENEAYMLRELDMMTGTMISKHAQKMETNDHR